MRLLYEQLGWLKTVLTESDAYSDIPDGALDVDRLLAGKPAFRSLSECSTYKQKKLLLGNIQVPNTLTPEEQKVWKLNALMALQQVMHDGFEVYHYHNTTRSLTFLTSSSSCYYTFFNDNSEDPDNQKQAQAIHELKITRDDVTILDTKSIETLQKNQCDVTNNILWQSDLIASNLTSVEMKRFVEKNKNINTYINNSFNELVIDKTQFSQIITMDEITQKLINKVDLSDIENTVLRSIVTLSSIQIYDKLIQHYFTLLETVPASAQNFENILKIKTGGTNALRHLAAAKPESYFTLLRKLEAKPELYAHALNAKDYDGTFALYCAAQKLTDKYIELLCKFIEKNDDALLKIALEAKCSNDTSAVYWAAEKLTDKYSELLLKLIEKNDDTLLKRALEAKHFSDTSAAFWVAERYPDKYYNLLLKFIEKNNDALLKIALEAKHFDGTSALKCLAMKCPDLYRSLLSKLKKYNRTLNHAVDAGQYFGKSSSIASSTKSVDANTAPEKKTYNLDRLFYDLDSTRENPHPRDYRLSSFDTLGVNKNQCTANQVFTLENKGDLQLTPCLSLQFLSFNVYQSAATEKSSLETNRFYAKQGIMLSREWLPLPSLSANETMKKVHVEPAVEVEIQYSKRDHLHYICRKNSADNTPILVTIDYTVEYPKPIHHTNASIKKLVDFCKSFQEKALNMGSYPNPTGSDFLKALVTQQAGACRHRAVVFKALLEDANLRNSIEELQGLTFDNIKANIIMNDCHAFVEIEENGIVIDYDLGGYAADVDISEPFDPKQEPLSDSKNAAAASATSSSTPESIPLTPIRNYFPAPEKQTTPETALYIQGLISQDEPKRLIECTKEQLDELCYQLQKYCQHTSHAYHYVNSPDELILRRPYVALQTDNAGVIQEGLTGPVYRFLSDENKTRTLIVNFAHFSARDLARFNSLLDELPNIDGVALPKGTKVIGLINAAGDVYQDPSFYSRFGTAIEVCPVEAGHLKIPSLDESISSAVDQKPLEIDFFGAPNWKAILLGTWHLQKDKLTFSPGILVRLLQENKLTGKIILKNPPEDPDLTRFFQEANLKGCIEYEDRKLAWPKSVAVTTIKQIDFAKNQIQSIQYGLSSNISEMNVINPSILSRFFTQYHLEQGQMFEVNGILAAHPTGKPLLIYVTEALRPNQWAQLLAECQNRKIKLQVYLAPHVVMPPELKTNDLTQPPLSQSSEALHTSEKPSLDCCIVSEDVDLTITSWRPEKSHVICIDVSELTSSDLLTKVSGKFNKERLAFDFSQENGALLTALSVGKTVILHGHFSHEMRQRLQDFLFERKKQTDYTGQVVIIADNKTVHTFENMLPIKNHLITGEEKQAYLSDNGYRDSTHTQTATAQSLPIKPINLTLPYVTQQAMLRHQLSQASQLDPWVGLTTAIPHVKATLHFDLSTAKEQTEAFNQRRLDAVEKTLSISPFVFLAGMTGVGKTSFVEKIWENKSAQRILYVGETRLRDWANDRSSGIKAIFIDEANITQNNWSQFEGLFHNNPPGMMIGNQYVELTANHKIIFAGNPTTYSEDRALPTLFKRHGNSILLDPLPPAYIYHAMLLPLFTQGNNYLAEKICRPILSLNQYLNGLSNDAVLLTPRELIMMTQLTIHFCAQHADANPEEVAKYFAYQLSRQFVPASHLNEFDKQFFAHHPKTTAIQVPRESHITITESNKPAAHMLMDFLALRESNVKAGLGGILLEGEPGLGKSELAIACLTASGFEKRSLDATDEPKNQKYFYHLPAAAGIKTKRKILERAFHEGAVVIYDEMNTAASLESLLNRLLMGEGPQGEKPSKPGFMLIGTQNPTTMAGRVKTSSALLHRMHYRIIPPYTKPEMHLILRGMGLPDRRIDALVAQYVEASKTNKTLCFRDVINRAKEDIKGLLGKYPQEITKLDLLNKVQDEKINAEIVEAVSRHKLCDNEILLTIAKNEKTSDPAILPAIVENKSIYPATTQYSHAFFPSSPSVSEKDPLAEIIASSKSLKK